MRPRHLDPTPGYEPLAGRFVTMLADTRWRLFRDLEDLDPATELDRTPPWAPNSVGTLLYHLAAIELDWTFVDLLESTYPPEATAWFEHDVREVGGKLTPIVDPYQRHLDRLEWVRTRLLEALGGVTDEDLGRTRVGDGDESGGGWILHHLMQHEAEHRGQIGEIRAALRAAR